jgi:hypothetical protein
LLLRFPRDLKRVAKEASEYFGTEISYTEVSHMQRRFRESQDKDVSLWVACNLAREVLHTSFQRQAKLEAMYQAWDGKESAEVSLCCSAPVEKKEPMQGSAYYRCMKCDNTCKTKHIAKVELEKLKITIIREMRKESEFIMKFAKTMGFAAPSESKNVVKNTNFIYQSSEKSSSNKGVDHEVAKKLEEMTPIERERVIKSLERIASGNQNVVDAEFLPSQDTQLEETNESSES